MSSSSSWWQTFAAQGSVAVPELYGRWGWKSAGERRRYDNLTVRGGRPWHGGAPQTPTTHVPLAGTMPCCTNGSLFHQELGRRTIMHFSGSHQVSAIPPLWKRSSWNGWVGFARINSFTRNLSP